MEKRWIHVFFKGISASWVQAASTRIEFDELISFFCTNNHYIFSLSEWLNNNKHELIWKSIQEWVVLRTNQIS